MRFPRVPVSQALAAVAALAVGLSAGCNACEGFNPYAAYDRTDPNDDKTQDKVEPGKFQVVCYRRGDEQIIELAMNEALRGAGGGSAAKLGDKETTEALLQFARAPKGPYSTQPVALGKYEVKFRSANIDLAQPIKVLWKGDEKGGGVQTFEVGGDAPGPATLIQEGAPEEWSLHFKPEAGLYVAGPQIVPRGSGFGLRNRQFDIKVGESMAEVREILDESAVVLEPPVVIYEITGFSGDMSRFLCELLREVRHPDPQDPDNTSAHFEMTNTYVWLDAYATKGGIKKTLAAECTHDGAAAKAENVSVEIDGVGQFAQTPDSPPPESPHTLTSTFVAGERKVVLKFEVKLEPKQKPADEFVVFKYTIAGKEYRKRVKGTTQ